LLLNEVRAGENYELVITNFYGGIMTRYRIGDMVKITSLGNDKLGINLPQMAFERRVDDLIDLFIVRLTEKMIWQAIENSGVPYVDWVAFKKEGETVLQVCLEPADGCILSETDAAEAIQRSLVKNINNDEKNLVSLDDLANFVELKLEVKLLPQGTFHRYMTQMQVEGADIAHLKPPHINPPQKILHYLLAETEEIIEVTKRKVKAEAGKADDVESEKITTGLQ
jgi:phenylacetate-coenzyme A ligase PaaK-like adenylate-forming protein